MPDGGPSEIERSRQDQLYRSVAGAARPEESAMFGVGGDAAEEEKPEPEAEESDEGGSDEGLDPVERLAQGRAASGLAQAAGGQGGGGGIESGDIGGEIQKQTNSLNHYLVIEILPQLFAFDASCFFLTTIFTMPVYFLIIVVYLGYQLYLGFTGNKSTVPYYPELTWESFAPPGTKMSIPLPRMPLYILTLWAILLMCIMSTVWAGLIMMAIYAMVDPLAAMDAAAQIFSFFGDLPGI